MKLKYVLSFLGIAALIISSDLYASVMAQVDESAAPPIITLAWSPDGTKIAVGGGHPICDEALDQYAVHILDAVTQEPIQTLEGHTCSVTAVAWSSDSTRLVTGSRDATAIVWNVETGEMISQVQNELITDARVGQRWSMDGTQLVDYFQNNDNVTVWNPENGQVLSTFENRSTVKSVDWNPDASQLAIADFEGVVITTTSGSVIGNLSDDSHTGAISVDWSADGLWLAVGYVDHTIRIWNMTTFTVEKILQGHSDTVQQVKWSQDSRLLMSVGKDDTLRLWSIADGQQTGLINPTGPIRAADWNANGKQIIYVDDKNDIHLIDTVSVSND